MNIKFLFFTAVILCTNLIAMNDDEFNDFIRATLTQNNVVNGDRQNQEPTLSYEPGALLPNVTRPWDTSIPPITPRICAASSQDADHNKKRKSSSDNTSTQRVSPKKKRRISNALIKSKDKEKNHSIFTAQLKFDHPFRAAIRTLENSKLETDEDFIVIREALSVIQYYYKNPQLYLDNVMSLLGNIKFKKYNQLEQMHILRHTEVLLFLQKDVAKSLNIKNTRLRRLWNNNINPNGDGWPGSRFKHMIFGLEDFKINLLKIRIGQIQKDIRNIHQKIDKAIYSFAEKVVIKTPDSNQNNLNYNNTNTDNYFIVYQVYQPVNNVKMAQKFYEKFGFVPIAGYSNYNHIILKKDDNIIHLY